MWGRHSDSGFPGRFLMICGDLRRYGRRMGFRRRDSGPKARGPAGRGSAVVATPPHPHPLPANSGVVQFWPSWLPPGEAAQLFETLRRDLDWQQRTLRMFGKDIPEPRLTQWMGEAGYRYSGRSHPASPWHPALAAIRDRLCAELATPLNGVLANLYRDQSDAMGWHADNERELGSTPCIASLSLGETRRFVLRHAVHGRLQYELGTGSLIVMSGDLQNQWRHSVPRERLPLGPRINLSFRQVEP